MSTTVAWFVESSSRAEGWKPLFRSDSEKIERAYQSDRIDEPILVDGMFYIVNISARVMTYSYDDSAAAKRLIRGTWFYRDVNTKSYLPFPESLAAKIDLWYEDERRRLPSSGLTTNRSSTEFHVFRTPDEEESAKLYRFELSYDGGYSAKSDDSATVSASTGTDAVVAVPVDEPDLVATAKEAKIVSDPSKQKECDILNLFCVPESQFPDKNARPTAADYLIDGKFTMTMQEMPCGLFNPVVFVQRGFDMQSNDDEKVRNLEVDHLVFVIHGIGESIFSKGAYGMKPLKECVHSIRKICHEQRIALEREKGLETTKRVEFITVEWHNCAHSNEVNLTRDLQMVSLPGIKVLRDIANEVLIDVVIYLTPGFRDRILRHVSKQMNKIYSTFCQVNPSFVQNGGKCSIMAHSLGTLITFDILSTQIAAPLRMGCIPSPEKLDQSTKKWVSGFDGTDGDWQLNFEPSAFLAVGSQLPFFISIRRNSLDQTTKTSNDVTTVGPDFHFPTCRNYFNLFHPHDPVAYRMEPMLHPPLKDFPPALVAHHDGNLRINYKMRNLGSKISDAFGKLMNPSDWFTESNGFGEAVKKFTVDDDSDYLEQQFPEGCPKIKLNDSKRVDYVLQEHPFEEANEYISGIISGHNSYFESPDVGQACRTRRLRKIWVRMRVSKPLTRP